ncbi:scavenger receptor cysteine-rich domain-containing protein DMBT1-like isoform X2 [Amphiura filiformis]|uniref:scavenger receptor cysteine-rich domain-containing protein DMBT1-like isoform X2 n=1 Tax=Amphiura filiformis TaxID=82378 RepID=UPI003B21132F
MDVFKIRNAVLLCIGFALLSEVNSKPNPDRGQTATRPDRGGRNPNGMNGRNPNGMNGGNNANIQVPTEGPAEGANTQVPIQNPTEVGIRLVGGSASHEGRVEVYHNDTWGTVCDDRLAYDYYWYYYSDYATESANFATAVCRQLGFPYGTGVVMEEAHFGEGNENDPIWLDNVICSGSESRLDECSHNGWGAHNCGHYEDVGVICDI